MTFKFYIPVLALAAIMAFAATQATAQGTHANKSGPAQATNQMTSEDQAAVTKMRDDFQAKVAPLRDQLWAKQLEYKALVANSNTKPGDVKPVINEMVVLKAQIRTERKKYSDNMMAKGYHGKSGMGGHMGMGMGGHKGMGMGDHMGMGMGDHKASKCKMMGKDAGGVSGNHKGHGN